MADCSSSLSKSNWGFSIGNVTPSSIDTPILPHLKKSIVCN
jgi:hypothetical protein